LISIFQDNSTSIENVYRETVENLYGDRIITNNATNFLYKLENLNAKDIQDSGLRETLIRIKNQIENLIKE
jgi:hypothetical protein